MNEYFTKKPEYLMVFIVVLFIKNMDLNNNINNN